jgi:hypothetical protein
VKQRRVSTAKPDGWRETPRSSHTTEHVPSTMSPGNGRPFGGGGAVNDDNEYDGARSASIASSCGP